MLDNRSVGGESGVQIRPRARCGASRSRDTHGHAHRIVAHCAVRAPVVGGVCTRDSTSGAGGWWCSLIHGQRAVLCVDGGERGGGGRAQTRLPPSRVMRRRVCIDERAMRINEHARGTRWLQFIQWRFTTRNKKRKMNNNSETRGTKSRVNWWMNSSIFDLLLYCTWCAPASSGRRCARSNMYANAAASVPKKRRRHCPCQW